MKTEGGSDVGVNVEAMHSLPLNYPKHLKQRSLQHLASLSKNCTITSKLYR